ncbi:MAG: transglutaminase family protein [Chloroflexi bacterium]|nr:transglutaminase family protein [Chloroflexota bacterium]
MLEQRVFRRLFTEMVSPPEQEVDLTRAALYIAGEERPRLDVDACLETLDELGYRVKEAVPWKGSPREQLEAFGQYLSSVEGFIGDPEDNLGEGHNYLDQVLESKWGSDISLSILYKVIGSRCGLLLEGIGLPGHFILSHRARGETQYLDPYHHGRLMTREDCEASVRERYKGQVPFKEEFLLPYDKKQMLVRLLTSMKVSYFQSKDYVRALAASDRIAIIDPNLSVNVRERARLFYLMGQYREAIRGLELYLKLFPDADDKAKAQAEMQALWSLMSSLS